MKKFIKLLDKLPVNNF